MQKIVAFLALVALTLQGFGQKEVVSAYNANKEGDFASAATYIEQAIQNPKANVKNKTWRYRGEIYNNIAGDSVLMTLYPTALQLAIESYLIADSLDKKSAYAKEHQLGLQKSQLLSNRLGISAYGVPDYKSAANYFAIAVRAALASGVVDSVAMSNNALSLEQAGLYLQSSKAYTECARLGFNSAQNYILATDAAILANERELALEMLHEAKAHHPMDQGILISEFNFYIEEQGFVDTQISLLEGQIKDDKKESNLALWDVVISQIDSLESVKATLFETALSVLTSAAQNDSSNAALWCQSGIILGELGLIDESLDALDQAIAADSSYFDAHYMAGTIHYNEAANLDTEKREKYGSLYRLTKTQQTDYDRLDNLMKERFSNAEPFFRAASRLQPDDCETLKALQTIYTRLSLLDEEEVIIARRKALDCV